MLKNLCLAVSLLVSIGGAAAQDRKVYIMVPGGIDIVPAVGARTSGPTNMVFDIKDSKWPKGTVPEKNFEWKVDGVPTLFKCKISKTPDDGTDLKEDSVLFVLQKDIPYVPMPKNGPLAMTCDPK